MDSSLPPPDKIIDFADIKNKAKIDAFDVDAWLAQLGVKSGASQVEAAFACGHASGRIDEDDVLGLAFSKGVLGAVLKERPTLKDPREINESFKMEGRVRKGIIITKALYLLYLARGVDVGGVAKPKRKRKSRRS